MPGPMILSKPVEQAELRARLHAGGRILTLEATLAAHNKRLSEALHQLEQDLELAARVQHSCCLRTAYVMAITFPTGFLTLSPGLGRRL